MTDSQKDPQIIEKLVKEEEEEEEGPQIIEKPVKEEEEEEDTNVKSTLVKSNNTTTTVADSNETPRQTIAFAPVTRPGVKPVPSATTTTKTGEGSASYKKEKNDIDIDEHAIGLEAVCDRYKTRINESRPGESPGLTHDTVLKELEHWGPNLLTPPKRRHPLLVYLSFLLTLFNILLIVAGILVYILYGIDPEDNQPNLYLGAILFLVAFANAFIEFWQHQKSAAILSSFMNMIPQRCYVIREGKLSQIQASDLVPGDVVFARMGDKIPADLLIFASSELKVDNSSLTGESEPQERTPKNEAQSSVGEKTSNPLEASNIAFNGTLAVAGEGYGIVIRTGDRTVLGQIAGLTAGEDNNQSPLSVEIDRFVKIIASIATFTGVVFFIIGMILYNGDVNFCLNFAIGVCVAWVPEGLPATMTMLLTIAAKRMAGRNVLVKDLQGVETLGAITILATDKTGTLTRNQMTVTYIWSSQELYSAQPGQQGEPPQVSIEKPGVLEILHNATLCSRAKFDRTDVPIEQRQILGDATESGLIRFSAKKLRKSETSSENLVEFDELHDTYPKVFEIPFSSEKKWAMTIHKKPHANGTYTLYIKGAPERVMRLCGSILSADGPEPKNEEHEAKYDEIYGFMAGKGHRVLAFAQLLLPESEYPDGYVFEKKKPRKAGENGKEEEASTSKKEEEIDNSPGAVPEGNYPTKNYCFIGLVSLEDPPKHGVREAIGRCREAGIQVIMVTGDHPLTAEAIGRKINLMISETKAQVAQRLNRPIDTIAEHEYQAIVVSGDMINDFKRSANEDDEWDNVFCKNEIIFARTSPHHKLEIVRRAQSLGHIVGVTGDGVNDSPALKKADLGIAMNISGSDVSKEAASMILLDDNFASTVNGIEEGRLIFTNLKKSIQYTISHSMPEVLANLLYIIVPIPLPLSAILILVVDLGFELCVALSFAWDKPETKTGLMKLPPRKPVTNASVERLRRRLARRPTASIDPESGEMVHPSRGARFRHSISEFFSRTWWREQFETTESDELVDANLLSWAYLEIGIIETIGALVGYFLVLGSFGLTPSIARDAASSNSPKYFTKNSPDLTVKNGRVLTADDQTEALAQAQTVFYIAIMIQQLFNMFACKARLRLPFGKFMFSNRYNFFGGLGGAVVGFFISYVPFMNIVFGTSYKTPVYYHLVAVGFGVFILFYATMRLLILRRRRPLPWNPEISGLQMHPTAYSASSGNK